MKKRERFLIARRSENTFIWKSLAPKTNPRVYFRDLRESLRRYAVV